MKANKLLSVLILSILIMSFSFAGSNQQSYTFDGQFTKLAQTNYPTSPYAYLTIDDDTNIDLKQYGWGAEVPKICDIDNDGVNEILSFNYGDGNLRVLNYDFDNDEIDVEYVLDVTDTGHGINDVVCIHGVNENYNIILIATNSSTDVKISENYWNENTQSLTEQFAYIDDEFIEFAPSTRIGCYEGGTHYWCYYRPQYDSGFSMIRLTNAVSDNTRTLDLNETAVTLKADGLTTGQIANYESISEKRLVGIYQVSGFNYLKLGDAGAFTYANDENRKTLGSDENGHYQLRVQPIALGPDEVAMAVADSNPRQKIYSFDMDNQGSIEWEDFGSSPVEVTNYVNGHIVMSVGTGIDKTGENYASYSGLVPTDCSYCPRAFATIMMSGTRTTSAFTKSSTPSYTEFRDGLRTTTSTTSYSNGHFSYPFTFESNYLAGSESNFDEVCGLNMYDPVYSGCYNYNTSSDIINFTYSGGTYEFPVTLARVNGEDSIITYETSDAEFYYYYLSDLSTKRNMSVSLDGADITEGDFEGFLVISDLNQDGVGELVIQGDSFTYVGEIEIEEQQEIFLFEDSSFGYYETECTHNATSNTTIRFRECFGTDFCSYFSDNELDVYEKICTTCGGTQVETCGDWDLLEPSVVCSNLTSATTTDVEIEFFRSNSDVRADLTMILSNYSTQDVKDYFSIANERYIVEIDTATSECDVGELVTPPDTETIFDGYNNVTTTTTTAVTDPYEDPDDLLNDIFGGISTLWKIVLGMMIVLGVTISVAQYNKNMPPFVIGLTAVLVTILVTALGLFPAYILILIIFIAIIMVVLAKMTGGE